MRFSSAYSPSTSCTPPQPAGAPPDVDDEERDLLAQELVDAVAVTALHGVQRPEQGVELRDQLAGGRGVRPFGFDGDLYSWARSIQSCFSSVRVISISTSCDARSISPSRSVRARTRSSTSARAPPAPGSPSGPR